MVFTSYLDLFSKLRFVDIRLINVDNLDEITVLPTDYRQYYPTPLPQTAFLRNPEGNFWTVKWTISQEGTISFEDGWSKFITDNALLDRDFLLFSYNGSRTFLVSIFRDGLPVKPISPVNIQEISDEEESAGDNDDDDDYEMKENDNDQNMIIPLSLGSSDEDNVDTTVGEVNKAHGSSSRVTSSQRNGAEAIGDPVMYLDDPSNPCFIATSTGSCSVLVFPKQVIKDNDLKFGGTDTVKFIDGNKKDRLVVLRWKEIYERNNATPEDVIICEILREGGVVRSIKAHFIKK